MRESNIIVDFYMIVPKDSNKAEDLRVGEEYHFGLWMRGFGIPGTPSKCFIYGVFFQIGTLSEKVD